MPESPLVPSVSAGPVVGLPLPVGVSDLLVGTGAALLEHCPRRRMTWRGRRTTWTGLPGEGAQHETNRFGCECGAELEISLTTPDEVQR